MSKLIWITGISKSGGNEYLRNKFLPLCRERGKRVEILYPGEMIFGADVHGIRLDRNNVLNAPDDHLGAKMQWVFEKIANLLEGSLKDRDAVIIKTHRIFKWENVYRLAHAYESVTRFNPDLMVTFVDGIVPMLERLNNSKRFRRQNFIKKDICEWQDLEMSLTKEWAHMMRKPHFIIPSGESAEVLYRMIFDSAVEPSYVAIDITCSVPEVERMVSGFVEKTRKYLPCLINPYTISLDYADRTNEEDIHVVRMCLDYFVPQVTNVIGYYPAALPTSEGKTHELGKAMILTKNVWVVHLTELAKASPFIKSFKTEPIFASEEKFFKFLEERQKEREKISWPEMEANE